MAALPTLCSSHLPAQSRRFDPLRSGGNHLFHREVFCQKHASVAARTAYCSIVKTAVSEEIVTLSRLHGRRLGRDQERLALCCQGLCSAIKSRR